MEVEQQSTRGIIEGDCIKLLEPVALPDGTLVELTITVSNHAKHNDSRQRGTREDWERSAKPAKKPAGASAEARGRQRHLLRKGIHLGGPPYPSREDLHER